MRTGASLLRPLPDSTETHMTREPILGVCYYPEHWPEALWPTDAARMREMGIKQVRIGEFAWSRLEPSPGQFNWAWLDQAIDTLGGPGLDVRHGTQTATRPKWMIDAHPEILAWDAQGRPRKFGSRRHYCFSSPVFREESARIVEALAERYGSHDAVKSWQTDNEYGCHNTVRSYSPAAADAFRAWLAARYGDICTLNRAWGTVFWSQEYRDFNEVDLPNLTVTEPNPSHVLDFYRFSSDQVVSFNRLQADIIRRHAPGRDIVHNFMGFYFEFDHFKVAEDLDCVGWDSYPIGFLDVAPFPQADKERYLRQGHPDIAAFHHDLYRGCGRGRWQVSEQQPGPVNWAPNNPAPLPGMVRLWTLEAIAHCAEAVSYFRWRQAPFAQEQMHAGLLRPDNEPAQGYFEAATVADDIQKLTPLFVRSDSLQATPKVGLIFSYDAHWLFEAQPQGAGWNYASIAFEWYAVLRRLGFDVDILSPDMAFSDYALLVAPSLPIISEDLATRLANARAQVILGPRTGSKTTSLTIPDNLPPGQLKPFLPVKITHSESLPDFVEVNGAFDESLGGGAFKGRTWIDHVETDLEPMAHGPDGGFLFANRNFHYFNALPDAFSFAQLVTALAGRVGLSITPVPEDLRIRRNAGMVYVFNYGPNAMTLSEEIAPPTTKFVLGGRTLEPATVAAWKDIKDQA